MYLPSSDLDSVSFSTKLEKSGCSTTESLKCAEDPLWPVAGEWEKEARRWNMVGMKGRDEGIATGSSVRKDEDENWEDTACLLSSRIVRRST